MKSFLSTLVSMFISISVHAQITGTVLGENLHPLGYANVALYSLPDSAFLTGTITNELGKYVFAKADNASSTYLKVSAIGYVTAIVHPIMNKQTIKLKPNEYSLGEVVVSGQRELFKSRGTDIVADIQHSNLRDFGFADDIIGKLSMVSGENGSYNIFGKCSCLYW